MMNRIPAEVFPPGDYIKEALEDRGWTQADLAEILGRPPRLISELIQGKRAVTSETAHGLAQAFGTSAQIWMNLETAYQLWKRRPAEDVVTRKANLYAKAPIKELVKRGWIERSGNVDILEAQVLKLYGRTSLDEEFVIPAAARKGTDYREDTPAQVAWFCRARNLARAVHAEKYTLARLEAALPHLRRLAANPEDVRNVPKLLADAGVRFLVVEHLPGTRIDGACLWLDDHSPVIVESLRFDRIDAFWFTLMHEIKHVLNGDGRESPLPIDVSLVDKKEDPNLPAVEKDANRFAAEFLVPTAEMQDFIARTRPLYYRTKIEGFAKRIGVHPGIVNGQLRFREQIGWEHNHILHAKIRDLLIPSVLTDGWGYEPPSLLS